MGRWEWFSISAAIGFAVGGIISHFRTTRRWRREWKRMQEEDSK